MPTTVWEYNVVEIKVDPNVPFPDTDRGAIGLMGLDGWELFAVTPIPLADGTFNNIYYAKRPKAPATGVPGIRR